MYEKISRTGLSENNNNNNNNNNDGDEYDDDDDFWWDYKQELILKKNIKSIYSV